MLAYTLDNCFGPKGSGKTAVIKIVFEKIAGSNLVMVSLARTNTSFGYLKLIASEMGLKRTVAARASLP